MQYSDLQIEKYFDIIISESEREIQTEVDSLGARNGLWNEKMYLENFLKKVLDN